jgi:hypothetical protein
LGLVLGACGGIFEIISIASGKKAVSLNHVEGT